MILFGQLDAERKKVLLQTLNEAGLIRRSDLGLPGSPVVGLSGADLREAYLQGLNLKDADLRGTDMKGANLERASLAGADLSGANLSNTYLDGADLYDANLSGANLSEALDGPSISCVQLGPYSGFQCG